MQKIQYLLTILLLSHVALYAQTVSKDHHNRIVETAQRVNTEKFLTFLEKGKADEALKLIDASFLQSKTQYRDSLTEYHKELSKNLKTAKLSIITVHPEKKYNTYRCRYRIKKRDYFYIELYYNKGKSDSRIIRISKKELAKSPPAGMKLERVNKR